MAAKKKPEELPAPRVRRGRPPAAKAPLTAEQLAVLKLIGLTPAAIGMENTPTLEGPAPESLAGKPLAELAQWLGQYDQWAAANKDKCGEEYRRRAAKVRWLIWKKQYTA